MILVDSSVWVDHLRSAMRHCSVCWMPDRCSVHPFVISELALGSLRQRDVVLTALQDLPRAVVASEIEVLQFIKVRALYGLGIGYVDAHLLASTRLTLGGLLWTRDKRLHAVAHRFGLASP